MATKYQLKNGMNVLLVESRKSPVVSVQMWVKTGSADEKKGVEGISHFIEHLVFKGSQKYGVGDIASTIESAGGVLNAYTTFDQTVFYVTLSKSFVDTGLDVISEMMGQPTFDKTEIDNEREVVIEEIKRSLDNPHQQASRMLFSNMYRQHPYGVPVIGYDDNIRRVSRDEIVQYYRGRYLPQNMNLVVVGDFEARDMKKKVERYFAGFKKLKLNRIARKSEPATTGARIAVRKAPFSESFLYLAWPTTNATHKDATALSVVALILGQGESSRLVEKIKNQRHLVNSIGAGTFTPKERGFFAVSATLAGDRLDVVLKAIHEEITRFLQEGPTGEEVLKAIRQIESERFYSMETVDGLAGLYGHFEFLYKDYKYFGKLVSELDKLTAADVLRIARKYISPDSLSLTYLTNDDEAKSKEALKKWAKSFKSVKRMPLQKIRPVKKKAGSHRPQFKMRTVKKERVSSPIRKSLPWGPTLVFKGLKGAPVASARFGFLGGIRSESSAHPGVNELTARVWGTGTRTLGEVELNKRIENMASGLYAFAGRNSSGLSLTSLAPYFFSTFELMEEILRDPVIQDDILLREKKLMLERLRTRRDKPAQTCMLNMAAALFGAHPYGRDPYGDEAAIQRLTAADVLEHLKSQLRPGNMVISVVGDIELSRLEKDLGGLAKAWQPLGEDKGKRKRMDPFGQELPKLSEDKVVYTQLEKAQSHIALAYPGLKIGARERYALEVMQSILSGQGGRLFVELRDKASLAYTVSPMRMDGLEPGYFGAYIGCSPEKGEKAVRMMKAEFQKLCDALVADDEVDRAKRYLVGRHDIALQKTGQVADLMLFDELYGLQFDDYEKFREILAEVTPAQIRELAQKIFSQPNVLSVVGPRNVSI